MLKEPAFTNEVSQDVLQNVVWATQEQLGDFRGLAEGH